MPTLNEMVYDIKNIAYGGEQSDDHRVSDHQVAYWIRQVRSMLVRQELATRNKISSSFVQHLNEVELTSVDPAEVSGLSTGTYILKSTEKLPETIQRGEKNTITSVESIDGTQTFSETTFFRRKYNKYNKYTKCEPRWYLKNGYLYITNELLIEKISVSGIFENPEEVANFGLSSGDTPFSWDGEYPISNSMASTVTDIILKTKMGIARQMPADETNDADEKQLNENI